MGAWPHLSTSLLATCTHLPWLHFNIHFNYRHSQAFWPQHFQYVLQASKFWGEKARIQGGKGTRMQGYHNMLWTSYIKGCKSTLTLRAETWLSKRVCFFLLPIGYLTSLAGSFLWLCGACMSILHGLTRYCTSNWIQHSVHPVLLSHLPHDVPNWIWHSLKGEGTWDVFYLLFGDSFMYS